ncbi:MAG: transcriptional regulator PpsR [Gammaproteobacteria bacterium]
MTQAFSSSGAVGALDADGAAALITAASDVALVLSADGVIEDLAISGDNLVLAGSPGWVGRGWAKIVTVESRPKVAELLQDARNRRPPRWRHLNHPGGAGEDVPVIYSAVGLGAGERIIAVGRDMRPLAELQQRVVLAQQSMEREYQRLRQAETRYRVLFQEAREAVIIVDGGTRTIVEANPAAGTLLGTNPERLIGTPFPRDFDNAGLQAVRDLLNAVAGGRREGAVAARIPGHDTPLTVRASLVRHERVAHLIVRIEATAAPAAKAPDHHLVDALDQLPDGFVLTDEEGVILTTNRSFREQVQIGSELLARGERLERWVGLPGVDVPVLLAHLRERGSMRLFRTTLRDAHGGSLAAEISAVTVPDGAGSCFAYSIRAIDQRLEADHESTLLPRNVDQLSDLVGRVPLKELVREATDMIERLCIEAALDLAGDNRASAADMLGLSRQSLYMKLRRHGLGALDQQNED